MVSILLMAAVVVSTLTAQLLRGVMMVISILLEAAHGRVDDLLSRRSLGNSCVVMFCRVTKPTVAEVALHGYILILLYRG